ncbi:MAG: 2-amino-4-hydroxy-6-hydroxymethyldihydropteridine diphosphokinase, partial [Phycisphaerales bacterium]|nr:2-amino-4-hydroxy-6-hydroxymethyldihydropteridine diphosphokinase [Phycisphaerales bacterium]
MPSAPTTSTIAIAAGSNLGDAVANIRRAFAALSVSPLIKSPCPSPLYQTEPVRVAPDGPDPGGAYVNAAIVATSSATPQQLLALLHQIERQGGRNRA